MSLPDLSDETKMLHIGRMTVLRKARRETVLELRNILVPVFNATDDSRSQWSTQEVRDLLDQVDAINHAIEELN